MLLTVMSNDHLFQPRPYPHFAYLSATLVAFTSRLKNAVTLTPISSAPTLCKATTF